MLDYQRIVDDVRSSLYSHSAEGMDFLRAAAADYSVACDEVNERLRQCGSLLRKGLRSEAIQLCEIDPNALDVVAILDFPERDQWIELSKRNGLAPPTPLMLDVAAELNEAYAIEQPLAALLQRHRLLALAHGPLSARIQVLRQLAELDANSSVWQEDLRTFEQERQKQIQAEVEAAARAGDTAALASLDAELSSPEWKNPPPPALAKSAAEATTTLHYWAAQSQLEEFAAELNSAMSNGRPDLGQTLYTRWNETIADCGWQPSEQLAERVAPALRWVHEHLDREAAVTALAGAVNNERSAARLRELHGRAVKLGNLPAKLEERYCSRLAAVERTVRRLWWLKIGVAAAVVVIVVSGIGWIVSYEHYEAEVATAVTNLRFFIDHKELEQAESLRRNLSERAKRDPRLQGPLNDLEKALEYERKRQADFSQQLNGATYWLEDVRKSLTNDPGQTVLDRLREELERIQSDLTHAKDLARTEQDRKQVASADEFATQVKEEWQRRLDRAFLNQYGDFEKQLTQVERDTHSSQREQETQLVEFKQNLQKWETASEHVSPALVTRIGTLNERLSALEKGAQQHAREERDERQITAAVGDIPGYLRALQDYVQHNPNSNRTPGFQRVAEESLCWQAVAEWQKLATQWRKAGFAASGRSAAEDQLALANTVSDDFADCAECESLRTLLPYLKAIAQRDNSGERIDVPLKKLFADPLVADAWMVETKDSAAGGKKGDEARQRYYFREKPKVDRNSPPFTKLRYVSSFDGKTKDRWLGEGSKVQFVGPAPQTVVAGKVLPLLKALNDDNWEKSFCRIIAAIQADHAMDPILKVNLLQQVLDIGVRGSHCLEKAFGRHLEWIKEAKINAFANWLDPVDSTVANDRKEAARKLESLPDVDAPIKAVEQELTTKLQLPEFRWVGWLHRSREGQWECLMNSEPNGAGRLFVVCRQSTGGKPVLNAIGQLNRKVSVISATAGSLLVEGRPVYLKVP